MMRFHWLGRVLALVSALVLGGLYVGFRVKDAEAPKKGPAVAPANGEEELPVVFPSSKRISTPVFRPAGEADSGEDLLPGSKIGRIFRDGDVAVGRDTIGEVLDVRAKGQVRTEEQERERQKLLKQIEEAWEETPEGE